MRSFRLLVALAAVLIAFPAAAAVRVTFYSHAWNAQGDRQYPHAFIRITGAPEWAPEGIDENYGFTADRTPAIFVKARGRVVPSSPGYVGRSIPRFWIEISDEEYRALRQRIDSWNTPPGSDYNLYTRNCILFVADLARSLGLTVGDTATLKPEVFLQEMSELNADRIVLGAPPAESAAPPPAT